MAAVAATPLFPESTPLFPVVLLLEFKNYKIDLIIIIKIEFYQSEWVSKDESLMYISLMNSQVITFERIECEV